MSASAPALVLAPPAGIDAALAWLSAAATPCRCWSIAADVIRFVNPAADQFLGVAPLRQAA